MILAGDIGGTKCNLALYAERGSELVLVFQSRLPTRDSASFSGILDKFLQLAKAEGAFQSGDCIHAVGFGAAGTILDGRLHAVNIPWTTDVRSLADHLNLQPHNVILLNDLVATAFGIEKLSPQDFLQLNHVEANYAANKAVIAAGTGLGEAVLFWDGHQHQACASEGGAADFSARNERGIGLLHFLKQRMPRVSCEEIFSGRGFRKIHEFLDPAVRHPVFEELGGDSAREITQNALAETCPICIETLDFWMDAFGAEAGNLALRVLAYGGVYLAGGIALKILPKLKQSTFCRSFADKAPLTTIVARIPIYVILNEDAPILGAAYKAFATVNRNVSVPA
ncbi:MAG TPA: glucokinase [Candidatus Saccharimonadales bacterium]|nr:glucokinase [Candidatus Saccharimonadales bacterium]